MSNFLEYENRSVQIEACIKLDWTAARQGRQARLFKIPFEIGTKVNQVENKVLNLKNFAWKKTQNKFYKK